MKPGKLSPPAALRLDTINQSLWLGNRNVALTPKAFLVLRHLMDRPGQLVTKEELLNAAWPKVYVSDAALKVCIRRLRQALGDESQVPHFIETIPWRGYRFIGVLNSSLSPQGNELAALKLKPKVHSSKLKIRHARFKIQSQKEGVSSQHSVISSSPPPTQYSILNPQHSVLVGRDTLLSQLHSLLPSSAQGRQQTVFLTGEVGIGKTAIVDAFLARISVEARLWVVSGQCIEHYGTGEPYLPILDALERFCHLPGNERFISIFRQYAPRWLVHMPSLLSASDRKRLRQTLQGATPERMLREFAEVLTHLTAERPLVLSIEDLHWSDLATLDLLSFLTRRDQHSRLLVLGTYRPGFVTDHEHPLPGLMCELASHGQCHIVTVGLLDEQAVLTYVANRFPSCAFLPALAQALYQRTEGNPLFMVNVIEYLTAQGMLRQEHGEWQLHGKVADIHTIVPTNLQQLIEMQIDRLSPAEQQLLEVASVVGIAFSAAAVAAAIDAPISTIEEQYTKLARRFHFSRSLGVSERPDGTVAQQYAFIHSLYQNVFYQRIPAGKRAQLHARIGQHQEHAYGGHTEQIAVELAMHFERGRDFRRAVQYRRHAAETALQRYAYREAIEHFTIGLELLKATPDSEERVQQEIALCSALGTALTATHGYASIVVERIYSRAHTLWQRAGSTSQPFSILLGLWGFSHVRAELQTALTQAHQLLGVANTTQNALHMSLAHNALGATVFWQGNLSVARQHYEHSLAMLDPAQIGSSDAVETPGVLAQSSLAVILAHQCDFTRACMSAEKALALATSQAHHYSLALARCHIAAMYQVSRDFPATQHMATVAMDLAVEKGFPYCLACSTIQYGWACAMQTQGREGIDHIHQGVAAYTATGAVLWHAYFLSLLAEAQLVAGQTSGCLQTLMEGVTLAQARGQLLAEADLYRIKGDLLLAQEDKEQKAKGKRQKLEVTSDWRLETSPASPQAPSLKPQVSKEVELEAEAYFLKSIEIARAQQATVLELRATLHLSRLWQQQGRDDHVRQTLTPLYERFSGEQSIADVREAHALLSSL